MITGVPLDLKRAMTGFMILVKQHRAELRLNVRQMDCLVWACQEGF